MRSPVPILCLLSSLVSSVVAQGFSTDFEAFLASPTGTPSAGQGGFYIPPVAGSLDGAIFTYVGNSLGIPPNPNGGANFYCGVGTTGQVRAQHNVTVPINCHCHVSFDVLCNYNGAAAAPPNNLASVSLQPSATSAYFNMLARWPVGAVTPPTTWDADAVFGPTAAGTVTAMGTLDPAFSGLAVNVWHTWGCKIDLAAGVYLNFRITNGVTNVTTIYTPLIPVPLPGTVAPTTVVTDFRLFTGNIGNVFAVDNFLISYAATFDTFGAGCLGALGVPTLAAAPGSLPILGTTFSIDLGNLPLGLAIMLTGLSNTLASGSIPLPLDMTSFGFPGCNLLVDPLVTEFVIGAGTTATWNLSIPPAPSLVGLELFSQAASLETIPQGTTCKFSNGGKTCIGYGY